MSSTVRNSVAVEGTVHGHEGKRGQCDTFFPIKIKHKILLCSTCAKNAPTKKCHIFVEFLRRFINIRKIEPLV